MGWVYVVPRVGETVSLNPNSPQYTVVGVDHEISGLITFESTAHDDSVADLVRLAPPHMINVFVREGGGPY